MDGLALGVSFVLGVVASIIAAYLYDMRGLLRREKLAITGNWAEFIEGSEGRQFSHGRIYFNRGKKIYCFDGTNFNNDGSPFCHWQTVASHVDREQRKFFYVFSAELEGELDRLYYGFGVVNLAVANSALAPTDGHYVSANVDGKGMSHTMEATPYAQYERGRRGENIIRLVSERRAPRRGWQPRPVTKSAKAAE